MERVYPPKVRPKYKIGDHIKGYSKFVHIDGVPKFPEEDDDIQKLMGLEGNPTQFYSLMNSISLDQISCDKDIPVETFDLTKKNYNRQTGLSIEIPKEALELHTIQARVEKSQNSHFRIDERTARYCRNKCLNPINKSTEGQMDLVPFEEIVISLHFYYPFKYEPDHQSYQIKFCQEYLVLGSQKLSVLRDKIYCSAVNGPFCEISENPDAAREPVEDNSAFIFITDTFYNDFSRPDAKDYSSPIIEWAKNIEEIDELKAAEMDDVKFEDLTVRFGYPQLYQHYGNCEHIFVFSDVRLLQPSDVLQRAQYPFLRTISNNRCHICFICGVNSVKYLVRGCERQITDPTLYCQICYNKYLYVNGKKRGDFEAFPYAQNQPCK
ncbi:snRNA-activating protein complex subunit 3 [Lutzomyia longipalpis]|uniref:snRNA-activating protein complex subunit 3 n=1 Tax=Lutzomyia longipalpis TaxID=7200 RepID=UPI0024842A89|nr:snRNA-activating protein complex subunit 3 [Lutzomyia longipalpis]